MTFIEKHPFPLLIILSAMILAGVYFIEYVLSYPPCALCLYQRLPWYFLFIVCCFGLRLKRLSFPILMVCLLLMVSSSLLAGHHVGVEFGWWQGPSTCSSLGSEASFQELKNSLLNAPVVRCDQVDFRIFGGSLAFWNFVVSLLISILIFVHSIRIRNKALDV